MKNNLLEKEQILKELEVNISRFPYLDKRWREDKDIVMFAVKRKGTLIQNASKELRADKEVALAAVENNSLALFFVSKDLKDDLEVVKTALNIDDNLSIGGIRKGENIILASHLSYKTDALKYASKRIKNMPDVVFPILINNPKIFVDISPSLKKDKKFIKKIMKQQIRIYPYLSEKLKNDKELGLLVAQNKEMWSLITELGNDLKSDFEIARCAIKNHPQTFYCFDMNIRNNYDIAKLAINSRDDLINQVGEKLLNDKEFLYEFEKIIMKYKAINKTAYNTLLLFKREDELMERLNQIDAEENNKKNIKRKI